MKESEEGGRLAFDPDQLRTLGAGVSKLSNPGAPPAQASYRDIAMRILRMRSTQAEIFGKDLFRDPAWDMLVDMYVAAVDGRETTVSSACFAANVPFTTGLRHVARLEKAGFLERRSDPHDCRRVILRPTEGVMTGIERTLELFVRRH